MTIVVMKDFWNKDRLGDQHQKMKDCRGKERGDGQRLRPSLRGTKKVSEVEKGRAAPRKRKGLLLMLVMKMYKHPLNIPFFIQVSFCFSAR